MKSIYLRDFISFLFLLLVSSLEDLLFTTYKKKFGETIRQEGPASHMSKKELLLWGSADYFSLLLSTFLVADMKNSFILLLVFSTLIFAGIGFIDDYKNLR